MLRYHGNPVVVAGRYRENTLGLAFGIQLIGPELFPFYRTILLINFSITAVVLSIVIPLLKMPGGINRVLTPLALQFVCVTIIFMALERGKDHILNRWDP